MPKQIMDFSKTVIYKICCKDLSVKDVYVGSTTCIVKRRYEHKNTCANENRKAYNLQIYRFIRDHGGFENWDVIVVEQYPCENSEQKRTRERHWMETLGATLNSNRAIITEQEVKEEMKVYYTDHVAEIREKCKKYYTEHAAEMKGYLKVYRTEHAAEIKAQQAERITCQCGVEHSRGAKFSHLRTAKHVKAMAAL